MDGDLVERIELALGSRPAAIDPLSGGSVGSVYQVSLGDGTKIVAKLDESGSTGLDLEAYMLSYLKEQSHLPVPSVIFSDETILLTEFLQGRSTFSEKAQKNAAELLAELHNITSDKYGFERDTLIGGLHQPNPLTRSWIEFFREKRLLYMGGEAYRSGRLPKALHSRLLDLCERLEEWIVEPDQPSLIHGDAWSGNILAESNRVTGFVDPAIYLADPEIELAFISLFHTFGDHFFERYDSLKPIRAGFFEERRHIYNLYPLLVHVRLFGGRYVAMVDDALRRYGY